MTEKTQKKHVSVDMQSGLINKVSVTPTNVSDAKSLKNVCPSQEAIYADKAYLTKGDKLAATRRNSHLRSIKKKYER